MGIFGSIGKALGSTVGKLPGMGAVAKGVSKVPGVAKVGGTLGLPGMKPPTTVGSPLTVGGPAGAPAGPAAGAAGGLVAKALSAKAAAPTLAAKPLTSADAGALGSDTDLAKPAVMARKTFSARGFRGGRR